MTGHNFFNILEDTKGKNQPWQGELKKNWRAVRFSSPQPHKTASVSLQFPFESFQFPFNSEWTAEGWTVALEPAFRTQGELPKKKLPFEARVNCWYKNRKRNSGWTELRNCTKNSRQNTARKTKYNETVVFQRKLWCRRQNQPWQGKESALGRNIPWQGKPQGTNIFQDYVYSD